jgi:hypothetical protein
MLCNNGACTTLIVAIMFNGLLACDQHHKKAVPTKNAVSQDAQDGAASWTSAMHPLLVEMASLGWNTPTFADSLDAATSCKVLNRIMSVPSFADDRSINAWIEDESLKLTKGQEKMSYYMRLSRLLQAVKSALDRCESTTDAQRRQCVRFMLNVGMISRSGFGEEQLSGIFLGKALLETSLQLSREAMASARDSESLELIQQIDEISKR